MLPGLLRPQAEMQDVFPSRMFPWHCSLAFSRFVRMAEIPSFSSQIVSLFVFVPHKLGARDGGGEDIWVLAGCWVRVEALSSQAA